MVYTPKTRPFDLVACERVMCGERLKLTPQERRYVAVVMARQGSTQRDIAAALHIEPRSVERILAVDIDDTSPDDEIAWPGAGRDQLAEWAGQEALRLATDVHDLDPRDIWVQLSHLNRVELQALVIAAAAVIPTDRTANELLGHLREAV